VAKRSFRRGRLSEQVVEEVERLIEEQYPEPGMLLPKESELAERFHVSRIVIREGMKILEDRGLVEVRAGRGTMTVAPNSDRVKDSLLRLFRDQPMPALADLELMLELREVLEETVASLAAVRATPEDLEQIAASLAVMEARESTPQVVEADLQFHIAMAKAAHNRYYEIVLEPLTSVMMQQIKLTDSVSVGLELHRAVYEQVRKGNPVGARQAVRRLMSSTREHTRRALSALLTATSDPGTPGPGGATSRRSAPK
jgi:GntR family transcriptional repressor for pyruvate dehydrogenase complex